MRQELQGFLYHSQLDSTAQIGCIADIVKEARDFNATHTITGVLMFDGHRFAQYIEGPPDKIELLIGMLAKDPRHTDFTPQHNVLRAGGRLFADWCMAYVHLDSDDPLKEITALSGDPAMVKLAEMLPTLDYG